MTIIRIIYKNDVNFPSGIFAEYLLLELHTTNNYCESFHRQLNNSFNSTQIFLILWIFKKYIQRDTYIALKSQGSRNRLTI